MTTVVTDNCMDCRFTDCVTVCPVQCFHADDRMVYINPKVCLDCGACITECPVEAIYEEAELPEDLYEWIAINAERSIKFPVINSKQDPLPTANRRKAQLGY